ncbi:hypothetical protein Taro_016761 [Colocasia esculenta]|uniref:Uncharacterized protein n=1 Tax=Colocasia esculenta TaxID=4460 RepID=A0A843UL97_COLES|nr:hypothetical protein [Colocasia esculenta]
MVPLHQEKPRAHSRTWLTQNLGLSTEEAFQNRRRTTTLGNAQTTIYTYIFFITNHSTNVPMHLLPKPCTLNIDNRITITRKACKAEPSAVIATEAMTAF